MLTFNLRILVNIIIRQVLERICQHSLTNPKEMSHSVGCNQIPENTAGRPIAFKVPQSRPIGIDFPYSKLNILFSFQGPRTPVIVYLLLVILYQQHN